MPGGVIPTTCSQLATNNRILALTNSHQRPAVGIDSAGVASTGRLAPSHFPGVPVRGEHVEPMPHLSQTRGSRAEFILHGCK
jgi:hypothetical protein